MSSADSTGESSEIPSTQSPVTVTVRGGNIRNLGYVGTAEISNLDSFVFNGPLVSQGMPDFTGKLTADDVAKIKAFIQGTADAIRPK